MSRFQAKIQAAVALSMLVYFCPGSPAQQPRPGESGGAPIGSKNLLSLATDPAVGRELRVSDKQKTQLKSLSARDEQAQVRWMDQMGVGRTGIFERPAAMTQPAKTSDPAAA